MIKEQAIEELVSSIFTQIKFPQEPNGLYRPLSYMIEIGGKRIRPKAMLTVYSIFRNKIEEGVVSCAEALEVFHSFTLMHDDIMDNAPLRRGIETVWKKWNDNTAILSGDVMLIDAYRRISRCPKRCHGAVMDLFTDTADKVCQGQQYDMDFENEQCVAMDDYIMMIGLKTACLIACATKMGALLAGCPEDISRAFYDYGYNLGLAFQIADDYLDTYGDSTKFGKKIGGDIENAKKTWLLTRTYDDISDKNILTSAMGLPPRERYDAVKTIYDSLAIASKAQEEIERYHTLAMKSIEGIGLGDLALKRLSRFADKLAMRDK